MRPSRTSRRNISHSPLLCALLFVVVASRPASAQSTKVNSRLVGTWHSVEIRCAADEECANTVNQAQLSVEKTGSFKWVRYEDLKKSDVCSWQVSPDSPDALDSEDCQVAPDANSDRFEFRLSGNTLILAGIEVDPKPRELISMRFERRPLVLQWREWKKPEPETCNAAQLPRWANSATQIASDGDLAWSRPADSPRLIRDRNRLLWDAVRAYSGSGPSIALKAITSSIEGDGYEEYLLVSRNHVEVVDHTDDGLITNLNTCTRWAPIIKLKMQNSKKVWRFATSAPSSTRRAYVVFPAVFPWDDSGSGRFPGL